MLEIINNELWEATPLKISPRVEVDVYIEGYRPHKDVWLHHTETFPNVYDAVTYVNKLQMATTEERNELLGFNNPYLMPDGWYDFHYEHCTITEIQADGTVHEWKRVK